MNQSSFARTVAFLGDSILVGSTGDITIQNGRVDRPFPLRAYQLLNNPAYVPSNRPIPKATNGFDPDQGGFINLGIGGQFIVSVDPATALVFKPCAVGVHCGINDLFATAATVPATAITVAAMQAAALALCVALIAGGAQPFFGEIIFSGALGAERDAGRVTYNTWLHTTLAAAGATIVSCAAPVGNPTDNPANFQVDATSLTQAGYDILGATYAPIIPPLCTGVGS